MAVDKDLVILVGTEGVQKFVRDMNMVQSSGTKSFNRVGAAAGKSTGAFKSMAAEIPGLGRAMSLLSNPFAIVGGALTGLVALGIKAVKANAAFEESLDNLQAITGASGKDLEFLRDKALEIGPAYQTSAKDVLVANKLVASAKPELLENASALSDVTEQALLLKNAAGDLSAEGSVEALTGLLNQFSLGADQASRAANVLAAGAQKGAAEIPAIASSLKEFGIVAKTGNISLEQSVGLVETLAEKGLKGSRSGILLRNTLLKLSTGVDKFNPEVVGLNTALDNLADANLTNTELVKMFGERSLVAAKILIENRASVDKYAKAVTGTNAAQKQAGINSDNLNAAMTTLKETINNQLIKAGGELDGSIKKIVLGFAEFVENTDDAVLSLKTVAEVAIFAVKAFTDITKSLGLVSEEMSAAEVAATAFNKVVALATPRVWIEIVQAIANLRSEVEKTANSIAKMAGLPSPFPVEQANKYEKRMGILKAQIRDFQKATGASNDETKLFFQTIKDFDPTGKSNAEITKELADRWLEFKAAQDALIPTNLTASREMEKTTEKVKEQKVKVDELTASVKQASDLTFLGSSLGGRAERTEVVGIEVRPEVPDDAITNFLNSFLIFGDAASQLKMQIQEIGKATLSAMGDFAFGLGEAIATGKSAKEVFLSFVQTVVSQATRMAGMAMLNIAANPLTPFPANAIFLAAGLAVLGLGGLLSGAIGNQAGGSSDVGSSPRIGSGRPDGGGGVASGPQGLGGIAEQEFDPAPPVNNITVLVGSEEVHGVIRREDARRTQRSGR